MANNGTQQKENKGRKITLLTEDDSPTAQDAIVQGQVKMGTLNVACENCFKLRKDLHEIRRKNIELRDKCNKLRSANVKLEELCQKNKIEMDE